MIELIPLIISPQASQQRSKQESLQKYGRGGAGRTVGLGELGREHGLERRVKPVVRLQVLAQQVAHTQPIELRVVAANQLGHVGHHADCAPVSSACTWCW